MILKRTSKRKLFLLVGDIFVIILSINLAFVIRLKTSIIFGLRFKLSSILLLLVIYIISFYIFDLYNIRLKYRSIRFLGSVVGSLILITLLMLGLFYIFPYAIGRGVFFISLAFTGIFIVAWRLTFSFFFKLTVPERNILIIGSGTPAKAIYSLTKENPEYKVIGFISDNPKKKEFKEVKILGNSFSLEKIANDQNINDIVVTIDPARNIQLNRALVNCKMKGINIYDMPTFYENLMNKLPISYIKEKWFLYSDGFINISSKVYKRLKRVMDLLVSSILLVCFFPLGLIASIAIKLSSKGSIFYIQERVGENRKPFNLIKFRTMVADAEKGVPKWAEERDQRVTRVGKILRKTRLDELPQLINVTKGEMSLIGPRPEREFFVKKLIEKIPFYSFRFSVKPGLTGWAQVNYRYGSSIQDALEKLQYELYYIKNMSLFLDFRILLKTIRIAIFGMGR